MIGIDDGPFGGREEVVDDRGVPADLPQAAAAGEVDELVGFNVGEAERGRGGVDLVGLLVEGPVRVFLNTAASAEARGHWLCVRLRAKKGNRDGLGARVVADWKGGSRRAEIRTAGGYQSSVPAEAHFGLGPIERVDRLIVRWPSGREQVLEGVAVDRVVVVDEADER